MNDSIRGQARYFKEVSLGQTQIWQFLITRMDANNNPLDPIPVELRSQSISGIINEGDEVEVFEKWTPPKQLVASRVFNHTTHSEILARNKIDDYQEIDKLMRPFKIKMRKTFLTILLLAGIFFLFVYLLTR
jgi:hypothetical protein